MSVKTEREQIYDVCIVGAGPGGSSAAFYLANKGIKVVLLEKETFPRRKICGDAISQIAQKHLERMGVLQEIILEKKGHYAAVGGLISPRGIKYIDNSADHIGSHLMIAIKREIMDEKMAKAAVREGATLIEGINVKEVRFDGKNQYWRIKAFDNKETILAKVLIAADGAVSKIARSINLVTEPITAVCTSIYIKAGTHNYTDDGVCLYTKDILPGYVALFKEADGDVVFCCYIIPGGKYKNEDLQNVHKDFLKNEPYVVEALGKEAINVPILSGPLRLGGIKKSYAKNVLVVGDAAGHIDPLTGEGIQYAMDAGMIAAEVLEEAFKKNDFSEQMFKKYQRKWMRKFGRDFKWSNRMVKIIAKFPIFIDAFAYLCNKKGTKYMVKWAKIMTGSQTKLSFFLPNLAFPLLFATIKLAFTKNKKVV